MSNRLGLVSDTHLPKPSGLPRLLWDAFRGSDAILHAGDVVDLAHIHPLTALAPLYLVSGNSDPPEVESRCGWRRAFRWRGWRIGLVHGDAGQGWSIPERARNVFRGEPPAWEEIPALEAAPSPPPPSHVPAPPGLPLMETMGEPSSAELDCIVFGHTHEPYCQIIDRVLMINPGSPTERRRQPRGSFAVLECLPGAGLVVRFSYV